MRRAVPGRSGRLWLWLLAWCLSGCAVLASKQEYRAYRAVRLAETRGQRLSLMHDYLRAYPGGYWAAEFEAARQSAESNFFEAVQDDGEGLEAYLAAYPDGRFSDQARARLAALQVLQAREAAAKQRAAAEEQALRTRRAELRRTWVTRFLKHWFEMLVTVDNWHQAIADFAASEPALSAAFSRPPRPRCTAQECIKYYSAQYPVEAGARTAQRTMQLIVRLRMNRGQVSGVDLLLPGWGFSRWREAETGSAVRDGDSAERRTAVAWAVDRIEALLQEMGSLQVLREDDWPAFAAPALGPGGARIDPEAEDPTTVLLAATDGGNQETTSHPPGAIGRPAPVAHGGAASDAASELDDPEIPELTLAPVVVPRGKVRPSKGASDPEGAPEAGPFQVTPLPAAEAPVATATPEVRTYRLGDLRVLVFAAGGLADAPAFDGIRIAPR